MVFNNSGDFVAFTEAERYLQEQGYSVGTMCGPMPVGFKKGEYRIAKWRNLSDDDKESLDGYIEGNMRRGPVTIIFKGQ